MEHFLKREAYQTVDVINKTVMKLNKWCHILDTSSGVRWDGKVTFSETLLLKTIRNQG